MAGRTLNLLIIFSLLSLIEPFEVEEDDWEEFSPDMAALHRLRGLSEHMFHEILQEPSDQRVDNYQNPQRGQDTFLFDFPTFVHLMEQDLNNLLADIEKQKVQGQLMGASEISHSYSRKLLVMTDEEKSTNDRVQQEYSMDPHSSVIVTKDCLNNDSCVPDVDGYTVVKIFGNVSEDGQTVSGLSGSLLANLILKPSLEAAPVFSLDGNTTTEFQRSFLQVLIVRDLRAVLETNQGNRLIYQMMDQPNSVSSYQILQQPSDHSTQYDYQHILILEDDPVIKKAATYLCEKHPTVSSVYILDKNQRPKLIHGESVPLSEGSRLMLVGHGARDNSGEMRLSGIRSQDVAKIIQRTFRDSNKIKTISLVACEVGSDTPFIKTLMKELSAAGIETKLHVRNAMIQVRHTGQKITLEISQDGMQWRHKDDSKKVVATVDKKGDIIIRNEAGSKGEAVFTNERNFLGPVNKFVSQRFLEYRKDWPNNPRRFVTQDVFIKFPKKDQNQIKSDIATLEEFTWGLFRPNQGLPKKVFISNNPQDLQGRYVIGDEDSFDQIITQQQKTNQKMDIKDRINNIKWRGGVIEVRAILSKCYEIKSGEDVRNVIRHYAETGEDAPTYLMVNDWIYAVDPKNLYVYPVGKKLDNNQIGHNNRIEEVKECIAEQIGEEKYPDIRNRIKNQDKYGKYARDTFLGQQTGLPPSTEAWYTTYFTASVISESARNFRTFPLILMALDMIGSQDYNIRKIGLDFLLIKHPMARGDSWIDPSRRGFSGSATPEHSTKLQNVYNPKTKMQLMNDLHNLIRLESDMFREWKQNIGNNKVMDQMADIVGKYIFENKLVLKTSFLAECHDFNHKTQQQQPKISGILGGYDDSYITPQDLNSASELENSFKHESYYTRTSASIAEEIHSKLKAKFGVKLAELKVNEGTARIEKGEFVCELISKDPDAKPVEFRTKLSSKTQEYNKRMLQNIKTAVNDMEVHGSKPSHQVNKYVKGTGNAVGVLGLILGMQGAVRAFEHGDIVAGVMGSLQTAHGVTAMTTAVIGKQALSSEARVAKAATTIMRSPAMKGFTTAIPIVGIGFGIYNFVEDVKRGGALGIIDATLDGFMIGLDVVEIAQPELAPFITPINLVLSVVRMVIDDVYMGIQNDLSRLPDDAGVLQKLGAVLVGFAKGIVHFLIQVASVFYDWHYEEIEKGRKLVAQISDYEKYYRITTEKNGTSAIDFTGGASSWNGGGITFCLADQGLSKFCMDNFVSSDKSTGKKCWDIDAHGSKDIILGVGESHQLEYTTLQKKILMIFPAGSVTVVSGYEALSYSIYGKYKGNRDSNNFFAVQTAKDNYTIEVMLSYYYKLYGESGNDVFFLGPQKNYVEGSGGKDTYIIPENGGKTIINNYDPFKAQDTLHFSVDYSHISVSKSGENVVFHYEGSHTVMIQNWYLGEQYRHMNMMTGDGVLFEISSSVISSVHMVAKGINKMLKTQGETVNTSQPLLETVTNILGTKFDDVLIGNEENNLIDGGGGTDRLIGGEGEDIYMVRGRKQSSVMIENDSRDNKTDLAIIEAVFDHFTVTVKGDDVHLKAQHNDTAFHVTLVNWFRSSADRHLLVVTKDLITFSVSDDKTDCLQINVFKKCIKSRSIDYSHSKSALVVDLQEDEALDSVTEVRGSEFSDVIKGNKAHNVIFPGKGDDFMEGRGGEDWYIITPGQGVKNISNLSPDLDVDFLFLKVEYENITCTCEGQSIIMLVHSRRTIILQNWFVSKNYQHLQIKTSNGITAGLKTNISSCGETLMLPFTIDYRKQKPEPLDTHFQKQSADVADQPGCYRYRNIHSDGIPICGMRGKVMMMKDEDSVKEMYGSSGFDIMVGNDNENLLDPYTGGALMSGGEGKDTYIIKRGYGNNTIIDNFAEDGIIDTVLVDMDFLDESQVTLNSSVEDLTVTIMTKEEELIISLLNYSESYQHRHIEFQSSDGVHFKLRSLNSTGNGSLFQIEAFKVTLKQLSIDCFLDLISLKTLSKVHTVQGCPSKFNYILGNDQDNFLIGGWKDDALDGGDGDDTLIGGNGADILIGGMGDDTLYGEDGSDTLMGGSGCDVFIPGPGTDIMDGGPGRDTVLYHGDHQKGQGVYVNLLIGQGKNADAEGDVLKDVETVIGTIYSDTLVSGYESSLLKGSDGNDFLVATGEDYLVGGNGNDIYMLAFKNGDVTIDNCAKDKETDVLYLRSPLKPDIQLLSDGALLTLSGLNQTIKVSLKGWNNDDDECGHLVLVDRQTEVPLGRLLKKNQSRLNKSNVSLITIITCIVCLCIILFSVILCYKCLKKTRETNVDSVSVPMTNR